MIEDTEYQQLLEKYKQKVKEEFGEKPVASPRVSSREYTEFKKELYPARYSLYEKACNTSEQILKLKVDAQKAAKMQKDIAICHLNITPSGVTSFAILAALVLMVLGGMVGFALPIFIAGQPMLFFVLFFLAAGTAGFFTLQKMPSFMANTWRMRASNQMIQSVFYIVTYMRHTSNLERAIEFAADHLEPPLSLDFRKILWDVETQQYSTIKDSAEAYLETWKEWDKEFVEAFHLIESSLYESAEDRRLSLLDKALDVILTGTYESMLHYAHNLKSPMTMLHMLGVILPILGLVILPLAVSFMGSGNQPVITALYIAALYNIALPVGVYYLGRTILSKRPAGYGGIDLEERLGLSGRVKISLGKKILLVVNPLFIAVAVLILAVLLGFSPLLIHSFNPEFEIKSGSFALMEYVCPPEQPQCSPEEKIGPYGIGSSILSIIFIAGLGSAIGIFFALRSKNVIQIRDRTRALEDEFSSALFQLGNRLGDGLPAEIAFAKVATTMRGTTSGDFFSLAEKNITKLGMGLEQAIFDPNVGAIASYPSKVIESSMKVLSESIRKGPRIAAEALLSMSRYIKEIHRVEERLKDLMGEIISSMKAQISFLMPAIAGIVIGITSMISTILTRLSAQLGAFSAQSDVAAGGGDVGGMLSIFGIGIPTFHFQIVVGIYIVQIAYILTVLANGIENGSDKLGERYSLGKNMIRSTLLYCALAAIVMVLFNFFANSVLIGTLG